MFFWNCNSDGYCSSIIRAVKRTVRKEVLLGEKQDGSAQQKNKELMESDERGGLFLK